MSIINCPVCDKRISSAAKLCLHCNTVFNTTDDVEQVGRAVRNYRFKKLQRLQNFSFVFVMLFATGAIVMYFGISESNEMFNVSGRVMLAIGFIGYVTTRIILLYNRRK